MHVFEYCYQFSLHVLLGCRFLNAMFLCRSNDLCPVPFVRISRFVNCFMISYDTNKEKRIIQVELSRTHDTAFAGAMQCFSTSVSTPMSCKSTEYWNNKTGTCSPCTATCSPWQYVSCSSATNAVCRNCSQCPVGEYLLGCSTSSDATCTTCTNKYEQVQCGGENVSISVYTGPGLLQSNCPWKCVGAYYNAGGSCLPCSTSVCTTGMYRAACSQNSDGPCTPCSNLPSFATFTSAGNPYNVNNCLWQCNAQFYIQQTGKVSKCTPCQQPSSCPTGEFIQACTATQNYMCVQCPYIANAAYSGQGNCNFDCLAGYYRNASSCLPCTTHLSCSNGQIQVNCTRTYDSVCTVCRLGLEYQVLTADSSVSCRSCTLAPCTTVGTYRQPCTAVSDSQCVACINGPLHSTYVSAGANGMSNCSWQCNAGFDAVFSNTSNSYVCSPCQPGSYSYSGASSCLPCAAGTYSGLFGATTPESCLYCDAGHFSTILGATSSQACTPCAVGLYQESQGSSFCTQCPVNTYGYVTGAIGPSYCLACSALDMSTRGQSGQQYETACICNTNYYRIDSSTVQCQSCPPGLICNGYSNVVPILNGSIWNSITVGQNNYYRLVYCPLGYYYSGFGIDWSSISVSNINLILAAQQCTACDAGKECLQPPCANCSLCQPGHYKACPGSQNCGPCEENTYEPSYGSVSCQICSPGTTTNGIRGCISSSYCVCDSKTYNLGQGCQTCPAGLNCFGNSTVVPVTLQVGVALWAITVDADNTRKFNLTFCPKGYYIAGDLTLPGQLQCIACSPGYECPDPPCYGSCSTCKPGFYKAANITYPNKVPRSSYDPLLQAYSRVWIEEPCSSCPVNTYRSLEGGTEVGACTTCPAKSLTNGLLNRTDPTDCKCDIFYYQQAVSATSELSCADCPQGAVCASDRSCALGVFGLDSFHVGDIQANLVCSNPHDHAYGTWQRNTSGEYRLIACPPGFTLQRSELSVTSDQCVECPAGSYSLVEVTSPEAQCKPCPIGGNCPGGSVVLAVPGFWQVTNSRRGSSGTTAIFQCPLGVCGADNTCLNNRTGLVSPAAKFPFFCFQCLLIA